MKIWPYDQIKYKGRAIGWYEGGTAHVDYISSFKELGEILDDPEATEAQKEAAQGEIEVAFDDFS